MELEEEQKEGMQGIDENWFDEPENLEKYAREAGRRARKREGKEKSEVDGREKLTKTKLKNKSEL